MIRHIFMAPMLPEVTDEELDAIVEDFRTLEGKIPGATNFNVGRNRGWVDGKMRFVLSMDFPDEEAWRAYMKNADHLRVGEKYLHLYDKENWVVTQTEY